MSKRVYRTDPIIWAEDDALTPPGFDSHEYGQDGFTIIRAMIDESQVEKLRHEMKYIRANPDTPNADVIMEPTDTTKINLAWNLQTKNKLIARTFLRSPFIELARYVIGVDEPQIKQAQINYKLANTPNANYGWHSDYTFWHYRERMAQPREVSMMVLLDNVDQDNAPLEVLCGSHNWFYPRDWKNYDPSRYLLPTNPQEMIESEEDDILDYESGLFRKYEIDQLKLECAIRLGTGRAGDVLIMDANTVHSSPDNQSNQDRPMLMARFVP